jgi:hypothetical protein
MSDCRRAEWLSQVGTGLFSRAEARPPVHLFDHVIDQSFVALLGSSQDSFFLHSQDLIDLLRLHVARPEQSFFVRPSNVISQSFGIKIDRLGC